tara:strand:- start:525 stop:818 length:294 start_codon:yes stop_codon:yes gene_type:complete
VVRLFGLPANAETERFVCLSGEDDVANGFSNWVSVTVTSLFAQTVWLSPKSSKKMVSRDGVVHIVGAFVVLMITRTVCVSENERWLKESLTYGIAPH